MGFGNGDIPLSRTAQPMTLTWPLVGAHKAPTIRPETKSEARSFGSLLLILAVSHEGKHHGKFYPNFLASLATDRL